MKVYLIPGMLGLLAGLLLHWAGFDRPAGLRKALGLRRALPLRSGLAALGYAMAGAALLIWLAVIDTDELLAIPADGYTALGGLIFGVSAALCGFTPTTAFAGLAVAPLEALCALAGLTLASFFIPEGTAQAAPGPELLPLGCAGLLLVVIALCIPNPKVKAEKKPDADVVPESPAAPDAAPDPESAPEDTFVAILEGEEPLVVDTAEDSPDSEESPSD